MFGSNNSFGDTPGAFNPLSRSQLTDLAFSIIAPAPPAVPDSSLPLLDGLILLGTVVGLPMYFRRKAA